MPAGRPSYYSPEMADRICDLIVEGMGLREIGKIEGMPHAATICRWTVKYPEFREQYARACENRTDAHAEAILEIADTATDANLARLQIDTRKWLMSKLQPKKYGDRTAVEITEKTFVAELPAVATSTDAWLKATQKGMNGHHNGKANGNRSEH